MVTAKIQCSDGERSYRINEVIRSSGQIVHKRFAQDHLVKVRLYGELAKAAGREMFELAISSVREAVNALHHLTRQRTTKLLIDVKDTVRWKVVVNGEQIKDHPDVANDLAIERTIETIDIYPVAQGAGFGFFQALIGALLIIVGIVLIVVTGGIAAGGIGAIIGLDLALAGTALVLSGLAQLFVSPGKATTQKSAAQSNKTTNTPSYLFGGSVNVIDQGGPVPLAYGKVICGSQLIGATITSSAQIFVNATNIPPGAGTNARGTGVPVPVAPLTSDSLPTEITPELEEYMSLTGMTEWPDVVDMRTPQAGVALPGPQYAIKHTDGSLGLIYSQDPDAVETNPFPQQINELIVVSTTVDDDILNYSNPNI